MSARLALAATITLCLAAAPPPAEPKAPASAAPPPKVVAWVKREAVPVGPPDASPSALEASAIRDLVADARVIGFGEMLHGTREPLQYRNRLIRHLVEHHGLTAIALESGLAETRRVGDYVLGGPGDAETITREFLGYRFGELRANIELVRWLRAHNTAHPHRPVRLYGIDQTGGDGVSYARASLGIDDTISYLERTLSGRSLAVRERLSRFRDRFTIADYTAMSEAERADLAHVLRDAQALFAVHRAEMIAASSERDFAWAQRIAADAAGHPALFASWTTDPLRETDKLAEVIAVRDRAMAEHTLWALEQEGPRGRILLFQANGHVAAAPLVGSVMRVFKKQPAVTGTILRRHLGKRYRVVATASARGRGAEDATIGSVDRAFAAAGASRAWLPLDRPSPDAWWSQVQSLAQGDTRVDDAVPSRAFDALLYFDRVSPAPTGPR